MAKLKPEDLEPTTGLADNFVGTITGAYFEVKESYAARSGTNDPMLNLVLVGPDIQGGMEQGYSIGTGWEVVRDGLEVVSTRDPDVHRWNRNTRSMALVGRMMTLVGGGDRAKGQEFFREKDIYMTEAEFYQGLTFRWRRESLPTADGGTSDVLLPVQLISEGLGAPKPGATKPGAPKPKSIVSDDDLAQLVELAQGKTEREIKIALTRTPGVSDVLKDAVFNKGLLKSLEEQGTLAREPGGKFF